ncbi:hypothetical protein R3W88_026399 [Solanum pinnatisectum]|uniref:Uncharacterized protein n=1 Tax=Solanum pinnatisectum TaxID=50273 RepID=A0AAV9LGH4_9SOLN|nr:hypothetical protein R3W88_026399 [Solanum pinnatisectum]
MKPIFMILRFFISNIRITSLFTQAINKVDEHLPTCEKWINLSTPYSGLYEMSIVEEFHIE